MPEPDTPSPQKQSGAAACQHDYELDRDLQMWVCAKCGTSLDLQTQVARHAKDVAPAVPVVLLTGWSIQQEEEKILESGVDLIVSKPCSLDRFRRMVDEALGMKGRAGKETL